MFLTLLITYWKTFQFRFLLALVAIGLILPKLVAKKVFGRQRRENLSRIKVGSFGELKLTVIDQKFGAVYLSWNQAAKNFCSNKVSHWENVDRPKVSWSVTAIIRTFYFLISPHFFEELLTNSVFANFAQTRKTKKNTSVNVNQALKRLTEFCKCLSFAQSKQGHALLSHINGWVSACNHITWSLSVQWERKQCYIAAFI